VSVVVRAWAVVVALALIGCGGGAQPKGEQEPAPTQPGPQPAAGAAPGSVEGATLHEVVRAIARRENLNIRVDPRVDGPVDAAIRARVNGARSWREQLELLAFAFDCTVKEQATPKAEHGVLYRVTFDERADVAVEGGTHDALTLIGAWGMKKVGFDPAVPDPKLALNEVGAHWRALFERLVRELGPYVIVEEGELLEVVPLERKAAQAEEKAAPRIVTGIVTAVQGEQVTLTPPGGGEAATFTSPRTGSTHIERVHDFLATAAASGKRRWAAAIVDGRGVITSVVVRTSAKGR
jgi:hypothetical protein